jgi:hypothetical protein
MKPLKGKGMKKMLWFAIIRDQSMTVFILIMLLESTQGLLIIFVTSVIKSIILIASDGST